MNVIQHRIRVEAVLGGNGPDLNGQLRIADRRIRGIGERRLHAAGPHALPGRLEDRPAKSRRRRRC